MTVLERPFLDGILNIAFFGIPSYIFIIIIVLFFMIIPSEVLMWWFWWKPFEYMHGIYRAYWDKINACFIGDMTNHYELIPENKAKLIGYEEDYRAIYGCRTFWQAIKPTPDTGYFTDKDPITRLSVWFGQKFGRNYDMLIAKDLEKDIFETPVVYANGIPIDLILDLDKWTHKNSSQRKELNRLAEQWNLANPDDEIHTYWKMYQYIQQKKIEPNPGILKTTVTVPWSRIKAQFPPEEDEGLYAGFERQHASDIAEQERANYNSYFWYVMGFFVLINVLLLIARFFHVIGKTVVPV